MKKIKSVKLKNDYRDANIFIPSGEVLTKSPTGNWFTLEDVCNYPSEIIEKNKTDLFEIEYEEERKYKDIRLDIPKGQSMVSCESIEKLLKDNFHVKDLKVTYLSEGICL